MDITIDVENYKLNIRVGGILVHKNKILTHKNINKEHYALPGGRVQIGENSEDAIKREMREELGKNVEILDYIGTIENFFEMGNIQYHEICFLYKIEFEDKKDIEIDYTMHNLEGKKYLQYEWIDLSKIEQYNILPKCLKEIFKSNDFPIHKINNELG